LSLTGRGNGKCQESYALGLPNPWRFAMDPNTDGKRCDFSEGGADFMNATAHGWELSLQNFGWQVREGPCSQNKLMDCDDNEGYIRPYHFYSRQDGAAMTGGAFVPNGIWPTKYDNKYFYADYVLGSMYVLGESTKEDCFDCNPTKSHNDVVEFLL